MKPEVTVGVCARNSEDFIEEAINSIVAQDFPHELMELIFVDDGSEDKTLSIIKEYIQRIDIQGKVFHNSWKGLGHARNVVVDNASGEYILWVDSDMTLERNFVRKLVVFMKEHPEIGIAKGNQALKPGSNLLGTLESYSRAASRMVDYQSSRARSKALGTGGAIYSINAIRQAGQFDENLRGYGEDLDMEVRLKSKGWKLRTVNAKFLDYERLGLTWKNLWSRYWHRGYFTHYFLHKNKGLLKHYRMLPPAAFLTGFLHAKTLFKLTRELKVFLLPFQYAFKMTAWYFGFIKSHSDLYQP